MVERDNLIMPKHVGVWFSSAVEARMIGYLFFNRP